ncbi:MAG: hypothetical protein A3B68_03355 [Candidatus Melainabacteria bacterium RIFCSPHIGHO2_02_FULL_34_12]|nr:MAG: hypothetical protein A3B68_03355 [Candidatus Melainabacteria bacterium RIFCSPHIGHO2_02_FULL_34_12]
MSVTILFLNLSNKFNLLFQTSASKTEVSILPSDNFKQINVKVIKGQKLIVAEYKMLHNFSGDITLSVTNSFGQTTGIIKIPEKNSQINISPDSK